MINGTLLKFKMPGSSKYTAKKIKNQPQSENIYNKYLYPAYTKNVYNLMKKLKMDKRFRHSTR